LVGVVLAGGRDRGVDHVVDRPEGDRAVEQVAEQFDDAAVGTVTEQGQGEDQLLEPGLGDWQGEEDVVRRRWGEGLVEGVLGLGGLLVDELAADLVLAGEVSDGLSGEGVEGQVQTLLGRQGVRRGGGGAVLVGGRGLR
jgi:hypothetical protein